ncbi:MAG: T9SS type A sorting domain-containing protein [Chitinophagaceae bacterium]|nr:T9SS type A sorting domain-containing protein [Chitinophagaceae bacterium]
MKKRLLILLTILQAIFSSRVLADNEVVKAATSDTQTTDPSKLGWVNPCDMVRFIVSFTIPANYNRVKKYDWYFNNTLVYTSTNPDDPTAIITMTAGNGPTVTCKVTYFNDLTNATSSPYTAAGFSPQVRLIGLNDITQTGTLALGCPSPVSYNTSVITNNNLLYAPPPANYTIKWTLPANWSFSSGNTGNTITANPDGFTTGNVAAYLQMNVCPYTTVPRTFAISYTTPAPSLSSSNPANACGSSQSYSVNPLCGAVSYTYSIVGGAPGCVFSANGLQTFTTAATSASINFPATGGNFTLVVSANYPNNTSSAATSNLYYYGVLPLTLVINKWTGYTFFAQATNIPGANYTWTLDTHTFTVGLSFYDEDITCGTVHHLSVYATTACGTTNTASLSMNKPCGGGGPAKVNVSPNPVQGLMRVSLAPEKGNVPVAGKGRLVKAARIVDKAGRIVRRYEFGAGLSEASINTSGLATNIYILQIFDGVQWVHQEIIVK